MPPHSLCQNEGRVVFMAEFDKIRYKAIERET